MDNVLCILKPHKAHLYILRTGEWCFLGEHEHTALLNALRTLCPQNTHIMLLDHTSFLTFRYKSAPSDLSFVEKLKWLFHQESDPRVSASPQYTIQFRRPVHGVRWELQITKPTLPHWMEEKLKYYKRVTYHSYALECVRSIKRFLPFASKSCHLIIQPKEGPIIFGTYQDHHLSSLRTLTPSPQESLTQLVQDALGYAGSLKSRPSPEVFYFVDEKQAKNDLTEAFSNAHLLDQSALKNWLQENHLTLPSHGHLNLDYVVALHYRNYSPLRNSQESFVTQINTFLRRWTWIQAVSLSLLGLGNTVTGWRRHQAHKRWEEVAARWNQMPWSMETFCKIEPQFQAHQHSVHRTLKWLEGLEKIAQNGHHLQYLEWTSTKAHYCFDSTLPPEAGLQKSMVYATWKQYLPKEAQVRWVTCPHAAPDCLEANCIEGASPFTGER